MFRKLKHKQQQKQSKSVSVKNVSSISTLFALCNNIELSDVKEKKKSNSNMNKSIVISEKSFLNQVLLLISFLYRVPQIGVRGEDLEKGKRTVG